MNKARPYRMTNRAAAAARTADRILDATRELVADKPFAEITLAGVATRSSVTVQTILRRFGDKDSVFAAAVTRFAAEVHAQRGDAVPNNLDDIVRTLVQHYEDWGPVMLNLLGEQVSAPAVDDAVAAGKRYHRDWCETMFCDALGGLPKASRSRRLAQLVAICDLRTWELLRIDSGLSATATVAALREMLTPLTVKEP
ncbi:MAG: TetR/AcrR family transcriptional regulator [Mycobacterium sp.]